MVREKDKIVNGCKTPKNDKNLPKVRIFALRGKNRPNQWDLTIVKFINREGRELTVAGLDCINETPILDIKPVMKEFLPNETIVQPDRTIEVIKNIGINKNRRTVLAFHRCYICVGMEIQARCSILDFRGYDETNEFHHKKQCPLKDTFFIVYVSMEVLLVNVSSNEETIYAHAGIYLCCFSSDMTRFIEFHCTGPIPFPIFSSQTLLLQTSSRHSIPL